MSSSEGKDGPDARHQAGEGEATLRFATWQSGVDEGFWHRLASLKLDTLHLAEHPITVTGFFAPCNHQQVSSHLQLLLESIPLENDQSRRNSADVLGNRNRIPVPGVFYNTNTLEGFYSMDRQSLLQNTAQQIWDDILSGRAAKESRLLSRFLVISHADLKSWNFFYWFAFPALKLPRPATSAPPRLASEVFNADEAAGVLSACNQWRSLASTMIHPFFLLHISIGGLVQAKPISEWESIKSEGGKVIAAFYDPCHLPNYPGWPLRNFVAFAVVHWHVATLQVLCYREQRGQANLKQCIVFDVNLPQIPDWSASSIVPEATGWELNARGKSGPRNVNLSDSMDPLKLAASAADLNLKLMRWRLLPSLDLPLLAATKCLLLGAGTLGCQVARGLIAWGVRHITFVDYGHVSMSNPVRQSLYTLNDCLHSGKPKAEAAAENLRQILPGVHATGVKIAIPMPGHSVGKNEIPKLVEDLNQLKDLVRDHDVVFLLTDTRESRWLPTVLCAEANRIAINAALGFDSYLVLRHGACPCPCNDTVSAAVSIQDGKENIEELDQNNKSRGSRLGCYFCNDVVAPVDSTANRSLDQQCTVTRPGLAPIAAALAVELAIGILHHPDGLYAPADQDIPVTAMTDQPLGLLPHQIRGFLAHYAQLIVVGHAFDKCTACSEKVIQEFRLHGIDFILKVLNEPSYLEDLTGLSEMLLATKLISLDWDENSEGTDSNPQSPHGSIN